MCSGKAAGGKVSSETLSMKPMLNALKWLVSRLVINLISDFIRDSWKEW